MRSQSQLQGCLKKDQLLDVRNASKLDTTGAPVIEGTRTTAVPPLTWLHNLAKHWSVKQTQW